MSAYLVYLCQSVNDRDELETYWDKINDTFVGVDIKLLSAYAALICLKAKDRLRAWSLPSFHPWMLPRNGTNGPAYTEVRQHRMRGAKCIGLLVDGDIAINVDDRMPQTRNNRPRADAQR